MTTANSESADEQREAGIRAAAADSPGGAWAFLLAQLDQARAERDEARAQSEERGQILESLCEASNTPQDSPDDLPEAFETVKAEGSAALAEAKALRDAATRLLPFLPVNSSRHGAAKGTEHAEAVIALADALSRGGGT